MRERRAVSGLSGDSAASAALAGLSPDDPLADLQSRIERLIIQYRTDRYDSLAWRTPELAED